MTASSRTFGRLLRPALFAAGSSLALGCASETEGGAASGGAPASAGTTSAGGVGGTTAIASGGGATSQGGAAKGGSANGGTAQSGATSQGGVGSGGAPSQGGVSNGGTSNGGTAPEGGAANGGSASAGAPSCASSCGTHKWACWPMPNPVGSGLPNEASYTDQGDTVLDDLTCLEWQKDAPDGELTWDEALAECEALTLGGHDDWRVPTRIELTSIVDFTRGPAVDGDAFPGAKSGFHKTSSDWILTIRQEGAGAGRDAAWAFNLADGIVSNNYSKADAASLRCVRGNGSGEAPSEPAVAPPDQYSEVAEGEVRDNYTGLVWQAGYSEERTSWEAAGDYCATLGLNGESWRLPSIRELATLVDEALVAPSINREMFPDTQYGARSDDWYWASHRARNQDSAAWALNFDDGFTGFNAGDSGDWNYFTSAWVKCVR